MNVGDAGEEKWEAEGDPSFVEALLARPEVQATLLVDTEVNVHSGLSGSVIEAMEPTSLDTFTIRGASALRSKGSSVLVTVTTAKTFVSYTSRMVASLDSGTGPAALSGPKLGCVASISTPRGSSRFMTRTGCCLTEQTSTTSVPDHVPS